MPDYIEKEEKDYRVWSTSIRKSNSNFPLLTLLCTESRNLSNSTLFMYRQQLHYNNVLKDFDRQGIPCNLDSLDPKTNNLSFLKTLHANNFKFRANFKEMPDYFTALKTAGVPVFRDNYDTLPAAASNCTIKQIDKDIKSYYALNKRYYNLPKDERDNKPGNYRPQFPNYTPKTELKTFQIYSIRCPLIKRPIN